MKCKILEPWGCNFEHSSNRSAQSIKFYIATDYKFITQSGSTQSGMQSNTRISQSSSRETPSKPKYWLGSGGKVREIHFSMGRSSQRNLCEHQTRIPLGVDKSRKTNASHALQPISIKRNNIRSSFPTRKRCNIPCNRSTLLPISYFHSPKVNWRKTFDYRSNTNQPLHNGTPFQNDKLWNLPLMK